MKEINAIGVADSDDSLLIRLEIDDPSKSVWRCGLIMPHYRNVPVCSMLEQTLRAIEFIIVSNGSSDN